MTAPAAVSELREAGDQVVVVTSRNPTDLRVTRDWLNDVGVRSVAEFAYLVLTGEPLSGSCVSESPITER